MQCRDLGGRSGKRLSALAAKCFALLPSIRHHVVSPVGRAKLIDDELYQARLVDLTDAGSDDEVNPRHSVEASFDELVIGRRSAEALRQQLFGEPYEGAAHEVHAFPRELLVAMN